MKYTPGPWEYDTELADFGKKSTEIWSEAEGADAELAEPICIIPHDDISEAGYRQVKANARLIAAAPLLLKALQRITAGLNDAKDSRPRIKADEVRQARAAIAKALE